MNEYHRPSSNPRAGGAQPRYTGRSTSVVHEGNTKIWHSRGPSSSGRERHSPRKAASHTIRYGQQGVVSYPVSRPLHPVRQVNNGHSVSCHPASICLSFHLLPDRLGLLLCRSPSHVWFCDWNGLWLYPAASRIVMRFAPTSSRATRGFQSTAPLLARNLRGFPCSVRKGVTVKQTADTLLIERLAVYH